MERYKLVVKKVTNAIIKGAVDNSVLCRFYAGFLFIF